jgi:LmbE family N-acetylglucosaminyl deacetylase
MAPPASRLERTPQEGNVADLALLGVFAHPDDEELMAGVYAQAAAEGIRTGLICATRGERGEISDPNLAAPDNLGDVREHELRAACAVLGIKHLWFLDYLDSGMAGTPENDHREAFARADEQEALEKIVRIVRDFRPDVMLTFDETGAYGHPDHLYIERLSIAAFEAAGDPARFPSAGEPWQPSRLYYVGFPRSAMARWIDLARRLQPDHAFAQLDPATLGIEDSRITNRVDVSRWRAVKQRARQMHRTQTGPNDPMAKMPRELVDQWASTEYYALIGGKPLPEGEEAGGDIFAGLR